MMTESQKILLNELPQDNKSKGLWINKIILRNKNLDYFEKILMSLVDSLDNSEKGCFAYNKTLAEILVCSQWKVRTTINKLYKNDYLIITRNKPRSKKRYIKVNWTKLILDFNQNKKCNNQSKLTIIKNDNELLCSNSNMITNKNDETSCWEHNMIKTPSCSNPNMIKHLSCCNSNENAHNIYNINKDYNINKEIIFNNKLLNINNFPTENYAVLNSFNNDIGRNNNPPINNNFYYKKDLKDLKEDITMINKETKAVIEYWNKFKNEDTPITKHNLNSKTAEQIDYIIKKLRSGTFGDVFHLNKDFCKKNYIRDDVLNKKWTIKEIMVMLDRLVLLFKIGYWPMNKKRLPKSLSTLLYNPKTNTSFFYMVYTKPPKLMSEEKTDDEIENKVLYNTNKDYSEECLEDYVERLEKIEMWSAKVDIKQRNVNNIKNKINSLDTKIMNINYCKTDLNRYKNMFKDTWLEIFKNHYPDINPDELDECIEKIKEEKKKLEDDLLIAESHLEFAKKKLKSVESYKLN